MANNWQTVQYGASGDAVKELQKYLNQNGFKLDVDGQFGTQTHLAVKRYQKQKGLTVDGIVGSNTWASLTGGASASTNTPTATATKPAEFKYQDFNYDPFSYEDYKESSSVTDAKNALDAQNAQKPGEYKSQWQAQLDDIMNSILNREKFSYNFNEDAFYQQYKDKFVQQGKMAMQDTMGQAAAMTGGYGNSYASTVGNQAYQASLEQLNDIVPELYQMAYDRYAQEGQDLYNQYAMLGDRENTDYGRYQDSYNQWLSERDYLANQYNAERDYDYGKYADDRNFAYGTYSDDRNFAYGKYSDDKSYAYQNHADKIAQEQWQKEFDEAQRQYNESLAFQKQQYNDSKAKTTTSSSVSTGGSKNNSSNTTNNKTTNNSNNKTNNVANSARVGDFKRGLSPESSHDAIARQMYGPYTAYVAVQLAKDKKLSDEEKMYLITYYGITETDLQYARDKGYDI